jgi:hypothetical protein
MVVLGGNIECQCRETEALEASLTLFISDSPIVESSSTRLALMSMP